MPDNKKFIAVAFITFCDRSASVELLGKRQVFFNYCQFRNAIQELETLGLRCFSGDFSSCNFQTELFHKMNSLKG